MYYPTRCSADFFIVRKYLGYSFLYPRVDAGTVWYTQPRKGKSHGDEVVVHPSNSFSVVGVVSLV